MMSLSAWVSLDQSFLVMCAAVVACPLVWNILARLQYRHQLLSRLCCGNPYVGCYLLAAWIFSSSRARDLLFEHCMSQWPIHPDLATSPWVKLAAVLCFGVGIVLVYTSMAALGVAGTFLGDYFGILQTQMITSFPFNVVANPMYVGSSLCYLGHALFAGSPTGIVIAGVVYLCYKVALAFEGPYTSMIYRNAEDQLRKFREEEMKKKQQ